LGFEGSTESGAVAAACVSDSDLARIIVSWPALPEPIRRAALALVAYAAPHAFAGGDFGAKDDP
jgi:hypothetical protein